MANLRTWQEKYSEDETKEEALIRIVNSAVKFYPGYLTDLARDFHTSPMAINKKIGRLRQQERIKGYYGNANVSQALIKDKKQVPPSNPQEFLDLVIRGNKLLNDADVRQEIVYPEIPYLGWIGLVVGGDWHFEHFRTNTQGIVDDLRLIGSIPNLYYGFNGDAGDYTDLRFMELENDTLDIPLRRRYEIIRYLFSLVPNTLFAVCGCHDNWVRTRGRWDVIEGIHSEIMGYYLGYGGTVNLTLGKVKYRIVALHKFMGESQYNIFHPNQKYLVQIDSDADVVCIAHRHDTVGIAQPFVQGKDRVFIRSGSHQYKTNYAWKEGFRGAIDRQPMLLLNGTERRMIAVNNFREGVPILEALNEGRLEL
jgi:hypothetical protein